jgi:hypothetical protein
VLQGLPGALALLPPSLAALVDIHVDPQVMEIQRQLNNVSAGVVLACRTNSLECTLGSSSSSTVGCCVAHASCVKGAILFNDCIKRVQHSR